LQRTGRGHGSPQRGLRPCTDKSVRRRTEVALAWRLSDELRSKSVETSESQCSGGAPLGKQIGHTPRQACDENDERHERDRQTKELKRPDYCEKGRRRQRDGYDR